MSDGHYLGETIESKFANEDEWRSYTRTRRFPRYNPTAFVISIALFIAVFFLDEDGFVVGMLWIAILIQILYVIAVHAWQARNDHKYGMRSISLRLHPGWIKLTEHYGEPGKLRDVVAQFYRVGRIESVDWIAGGCKFVMKRQFLAKGSFLLPVSMFKGEADIAALYDWAEHHGITIEGPAPIPGAYPRPVE
jgi:hypothetical protein